MFLSALCRFPTDTEIAKAQTAFSLTPDAIRKLQIRHEDDDDDISADQARGILKTEAAQDLLWALLNSPAFLFNR